jgi:hypothetical protein
MTNNADIVDTTALMMAKRLCDDYLKLCSMQIEIDDNPKFTKDNQRSMCVESACIEEALYWMQEAANHLINNRLRPIERIAINNYLNKSMDSKQLLELINVTN